MAASVAAFFRLGTSALRGRLWAEDGSIFLQQAVRHGPLTPFTYRYGGYLSTAPRLVAALLYPLPLRWQGIGMHAGAALVEGALAALVYLALRGHVTARALRLVAALCLVAVPVGPETVGSVANLQWFLVPAALVALLWTPSRPAGWAAVALCCFLAVTTSPFAAVILVAAVVRRLLQAGVGSSLVLAVTAAGFVIQSVAMIGAPRTGAASQLHPGVHLPSLLAGYLRRVLGDSILGVARFPAQATETSVAAGAIVTVGIIALAVVTRRAATRADRLWVGGVLLGLGAVTYAAPIVSSGITTTLPYYGGRYYVSPAILTEIAVVVLVSRVWPMSAGAGVDRRAAPAAIAIAIAGVMALGYGLVSSFDQAAVYDRNHGPSWAASARILAQDCQGRADATVVTAAVLPIGHGWFVRLSCAEVRARS